MLILNDFSEFIFLCLNLKSNGVTMSLKHCSFLLLILTLCFTRPLLIKIIRKAEYCDNVFLNRVTASSGTTS